MSVVKFNRGIRDGRLYQYRDTLIELKNTSDSGACITAFAAKEMESVPGYEMGLQKKWEL
jgi:hypothetical protein